MDDIKMLSLGRDKEVFKTNHVLEAYFPKSLTPREMDLLTVLFSTINKDAKDIFTVRVRIKDLIKLYKLENSNSVYRSVFEVSSRLLSRVISIHNEEEKRRLQFPILVKADYRYGEGLGYVDFKFNDELKDYLLDFAQYAKYVSRYSFDLDSFYAKRLYELIIQYKEMQKKGMWQRTLNIGELRNFLGIQPTDYKLYGHFKARIIEYAVKQINERTDIVISYKEIKTVRRVTSLVFIAVIKENPPTDVIKIEVTSDPTASKDYARLVAYGVEEATARRLVTDYPADVVAYNLDRLESALKSPRGEKIQNPAGWLVAGIEAGRGEQLNLLKTPEAGPPVHESKEDEAKYKLRRKDELKAILLPVREAYKKYLRTTLEGFIFGLSDEEQDDYKDGFVKYMRGKYGPNIVGAPSFALAQFEKESWLSPVVISYAVDYFAEHGLVIIEKIEFAIKKGVSDYKALAEELAELEKGA